MNRLTDVLPNGLLMLYWPRCISMRRCIREPHNGKKCLDACEEIIKSGKFSLAGNQKDVFKADNEDCTEAVFAVPFDQSYAGGLNIFNYAFKRSVLSGIFH